MPRRLNILIAGAGVAALEATLALKRLTNGLVDVEVLAPEREFVYRPMSVAEPSRHGEVRRYPLAQLVESAGGRLRRGALARVDLDEKTAVTFAGEKLTWDALLLALGADQEEAIPGALTFRGPQDRQAIERLVEDACAGMLRSIAFALPTLSAWPLPLYELALMTKLQLEDAGATRVRVDLVTPESEPLAIFGEAASAALRSLLATRGVTVHTNTTPVAARDGALVTVPGLAVRADRVVALPAPRGRPIPGVPHDARGFVPIDEHSRIEGQADAYAAGDMTTFPLKQGGIATQQADAAAEAIAAVAGAPVTPTPFRPILRGILLTGLTPRFLRGNLLEAGSEVDAEPLWWPPAKIVGKYLSPFLAEELGIRQELPAEAQPGAVEVEVELERDAGWSAAGR